jgi:hypothetical protein
MSIKAFSGQCATKVAHADRAAAELAASRLRAAKGPGWRDIRVYRCNWCESFHIGRIGRWWKSKVKGGCV